MDTIMERIESAHARGGSIRLAVHRLAVERGVIAADTATPATPKAEASKPASSPAPQPKTSAGAAYAPPEVSREERIRRAHAEAYAAGFAEGNAICIERAENRAAEATKQREADAVWAKAYGANNGTNNPSPSIQAVKPVYSAARAAAAGMSAERMAAADAIWDRVAKEAAKLRGHLQ